MPSISVIIPTYNRQDMITQALDSVRVQEISDLEILVCDDGSIDETQARVENWAHENSHLSVRYLRQKNAGPNAARNLGLRHASGDWLAFLDSDDLWEPMKLRRQLELLRALPSARVVFSGYKISREDGTVENHGGEFLWPLPNLAENLVYANIITGSASSVMFHRSCLDAVGFFNEELRAFEDMEMWQRLAEQFEFAKVPCDDVIIRIHRGQAQSNSHFMFDQGVSYIELLLARKTFDRYPNAKLPLFKYIILDYLYLNGGNPILYFKALCKVYEQKVFADHDAREIIRTAILKKIRNTLYRGYRCVFAIPFWISRKIGLTSFIKRRFGWPKRGDRRS